MISHDLRCIFIHIPKAAGTSIEQALGHFEGQPESGPRRQHWQDHRTLRMLEKPRLTPYAFTSRENLVEWLRPIPRRFRRHNNPRNAYTLTREQYDSYYKFTVVRNPWARVSSWYGNVMSWEPRKKKLGIREDLTLEEFLTRFAHLRALRPQTYWIRNFRGEIPLDRVCRFEDLADEFASVCEELGTGPLELPHRVKSRRHDYRTRYDDEAADVVARRYAEEIELFGYTFDG